MRPTPRGRYTLSPMLAPSRASAHIAAFTCLALSSLAGCDSPDYTDDAQLPHPNRVPFDRDPARTYFCDLPIPDVTRAGLPKGFCIRKFADLRAARVMAFAPSGELFVSSPSRQTPGGARPGAGQIAVLADDNHDGLADAVANFADALPEVHGLLFANDALYYTLGEGVYRVSYQPGQRAVMGAPTLVTSLPIDAPAARWTHTLARASDGTIYVSQGQYASYTCPPTPRGGGIYRVDPASTQAVQVSTGFRNPMYIRCNPAGTTCFAAELSDDGWGEGSGTMGREKLVVIRGETNFGYPCCAGTNALAPPGRLVGQQCSTVASELLSWPIGDTPFGLDFERGVFPEPYRNGFFVGQHGAFGSWANTRLVWAHVDASGHPTGGFQPFVTGWGRGSGQITGRITDVAFAPDGRLFFTDDDGGAVYWVAPENLAVPTS